jgi:hypothetical protein
MLEKIHSIQKRIRVGDKIVAVGESLGAGGLVGENERRNYAALAIDRLN